MTAEQIGVTWHSVIKYTKRDLSPLPYYLSKSNKVRFDGKIYDLPEEFKSNTNQRIMVFERGEVQKWLEKEFDNKSK